MTYNITLTANHQSLTAEYLPLAAESVQYLTAKVVCETEDWTGREIKAMFGQGCTVYEVPVTGGEITANQQLNLTAGDWRVWLVGNSARDGDVIPRITTNVAHISVAPTGGTEGSPFPAIPPTVEEQLRADMGNLADLTTEDKSSLVAAINEAAESGGAADAVTYTPQTLTEEQRAQARTNIGAYTKPASGIPKSDLADDVQTSLAKADTALQSQTIPDWNQNDETAPDYVKNRPFYTGNPVETVLVEESTVSFTSANGMYVAELESTFSATVGETYKVSWDGTTYECVCVDFNSGIVIGNLSIMGAGSDTGEPFMIGISNGQGIQIVTADTSASHTFSISGFVSEVVKIDEKYLPEYSVLYSGDPANWSNAKKQQMYDDFISGKLVLYRDAQDKNGVVLSTFYSRYVGLHFVFFENYHSLRSFYANAFSNPIELSESGINNLIHDYIKTLRMWQLYSDSASEVSVGDLLSMYVAFDSTTNKACILTNTKGDKGTTQLKSTIVTNGDADIILSSSTAGSTKKFKITVDDSGTITATEVS